MQPTTYGFAGAVGHGCKVSTYTDPDDVCRVAKAAVTLSVPRPLPEIVGELLTRGGALPPDAITAERLAGWRNDPDITAHLAALTSLDRLDLLGESQAWSSGPRITSLEDWTENNLAHLLEYTTCLKSLHLHAAGRHGTKLVAPFGMNIANVSSICSCRSFDKSEDWSHTLLADDACVRQIRRRPQSCSTASAG